MRLVGWGRRGDIVNDVDTRGIAWDRVLYGNFA